MSKHPMVANIHFVASSRTNHGGLPSLAALLLGGLALSASAQNQPVARVAPEKHFTIPSGVGTPVVLMTEPDAACDLHATGVNDPSYTVRLYANVEGYVRFHFTPYQGTQDAYLQLDCTTPQAVTTHPLHLRIAASPSDDMPAPQASVPAPKGSKIRPALTDEAAGQLSDAELIVQGYPPRPNAAERPEAYAKWLDRISRPVTVLPPSSTRRSDILHLPRISFATPETSANWSGLVAQSSPGTYKMVQAYWSVPSVTGELDIVDEGRFITILPGPPTYSALWIGLDGNTTNDLVQAGTEQDAHDLLFYGTTTNYYAWSEVYPQEGITEAFSVSPGDDIDVSIWVGDSEGNVNPNGGYAWFSLFDAMSIVQQIFSTKFAKGFDFVGNSAEWIMERPYQTALGGYPELADFNTCQINQEGVETGTGMAGIIYSSANNQQISMYEKYDVQPDNNVLSIPSAVSGYPSSVKFSWQNFH